MTKKRKKVKRVVLGIGWVNAVGELYKKRVKGSGYFNRVEYYRNFSCIVDRKVKIVAEIL